MKVNLSLHEEHIEFEIYVIVLEFSLGFSHKYIKVKVNCSRYRPGVAQRVGRGIALLFHYRGTRRG